MTKRDEGKFKRNARDFYRTPYEAVVPLLPHIKDIERFIEPCAGDGVLIAHLVANNLRCVYASDVEVPKTSYYPIKKKDALSWTGNDIRAITDSQTAIYPDAFITNPPWSRELLHPMIDVLSGLLPTWLLFDSDWAYTVQAIPYLAYCQKIVAVGRVCWFPETKMSGFDNASWYLFEQGSYNNIVPRNRTLFYGRTEKTQALT